MQAGTLAADADEHGLAAARLEVAAIRLLRARGAVFGPLLREALGEQYLGLFHATWAGTLKHEQVSAPLVHALLDHPPLPPEGPLPGPLVGPALVLRSARAAVLANLRYGEQAHRELARIDPAAVAGVPLAAAIHRVLLHRLAVLDIAEGRPDHAFVHLEALREHMHPELHADTLRGDPALAPLHTDPRWRALVGE